MTKKEQLNVARVMTASKAADVTIERELSNIDLVTRKKVGIETDEVVQKNNEPFDKVFIKVRAEFEKIATKYGIDPATLFCVYMEYKSC